MNVSVEVCRTPLVKDCEPGAGEEICRTEYESECSTKQEEHQVLFYISKSWYTM